MEKVEWRAGEYPALKRKVVIVDGPAASGIYDLNNGVFHRVTLKAGHFLRQVDGMRSSSSFRADETSLLESCRELGLIDIWSTPAVRVQTQLRDVIRPLRPVRFAWIEITSQCNQLCQHCFLGSDLNAHGHVSVDRILGFLPALRDAGARQIVLTGGEPFSHPEIYRLIGEIADRYRFRISILTNASHRRVIQSIDTLIRSDVTLKIPLLGWRESHDRMAGRAGAFVRTVRNIRALRDAGVRLELGCTVTDINSKDVMRVVRFAKRMRLPIEFSPVFALGYARANSASLLGSGQQTIIEQCRSANVSAAATPLPPQLVDRLDTGRTAYPRDPTDYEAVNLKDYLTGHHECGQKIIAVLANGAVTPCILLRGKEHRLGSVRKDDLRAILLRETKDALAFDIKMELSGIPECSKCEARFVCKGGGCPASAFAVHGSVGRRNPFYDGCYYAGEPSEKIRSEPYVVPL